MNEHDRELAEALLAEDAELGGGVPPDDTLIQDVFGSFKGKRGRFTWIIWVWGFLFAALMAYSAYRFFTLEDIGARLDWGLICIFAVIANGLIKLWVWMEMHRAGTLRVLKRIETRLALLAARDHE